MKKKIVVIVIILAVIAAIYYKHQAALAAKDALFATGNGRIEATEINIASKLAGRIKAIKVNEGDLVKPGDVLAVMDTNSLEAQYREALAEAAQCLKAADSAKAQVGVAEANLAAAKSTCEQNKSIMDTAKSTYDRTESLFQKGVQTAQQRDTDRGKYLSSKAAYDASAAVVKQAEAQLVATKADYDASLAKADAKKAHAETIKADIDDSTLYSPRRGRIQYRIAQQSEILSNGGRVLNLVDLTDVYMTFFLPAGKAGRLKEGGEARIVLDCNPNYPIPAKISYVASTAQFTPKTVETKHEREKLMFRIKARINASLLEEYIEYVKTGLPGVCYVRLDPNAEWPKAAQGIKENEAALKAAEAQK